MAQLQSVAENIWLLHFPLSMVGMHLGRNVTVIRLRDGRLLIHSTAPFTAEDAATINSLGQPAWLVDGTLFHDSFAKEGSRAFSGLPYFAPRGFEKMSGVTTTPLDEPPAAWQDEIDILPLEGGRMKEYAFYHRESRTLIVCDLLFNLTNATGWTGWSARHVMRLRDGRGISAFFRLMIRDRTLFARSLGRMMEWDFARLIVAHGEMISSNAKQIVAESFARAGFDTR